MSGRQRENWNNELGIRTEEALFLCEPTIENKDELDKFKVEERDRFVHSEFQQ